MPQMTLEKLSQLSTIVLALIAGTFALQIARGVLLPLVMALMIYALALPLVEFLIKRWSFPRCLALLVSCLVYVLVFVLTVFFAFISIRDFSRDASLYRNRIEETALQIQNFLAIHNMEFRVGDIFAQIDSTRIWDWGHLLTSNVLSLMSYTALVTLYVIFLFLGEGRSESWPPSVVEVQKGISRYIWVKSILSVGTALVVGALLWILGAEMVLLFTILTFALNFIPNLGSIVATLLPLPILWLQFGFGMEFAVFLGLALVAQFLFGNILEPKMLGKSLNLHPVTVMFFLVFWGFVWGLAGAILSIPLTVILKMFLDRVPSMRPLSALMEGRLEDF
jgi:AI-2 transport protein TqsA